MIKESGYCCKVIETEFNKLLVLRQKDYEGFKNSTKCWICKTAYLYVGYIKQRYLACDY